MPQGAIAPSANNIQPFRVQIERFRLESAWITNGFDAVVV